MGIIIHTSIKKGMSSSSFSANNFQIKDMKENSAGFFLKLGSKVACWRSAFLQPTAATVVGMKSCIPNGWPDVGLGPFF